MPRVQQASSPSARTPRTISSTRSNCGPSFTSRHAAPMQKRVAPASRAVRAAPITSVASISGCASTSVWYRAACGQYAQSSGQPPVLTDRSEQSWTLLSPNASRCADCARCRRSSSGKSWIARTSDSVQSWRMCMADVPYHKRTRLFGRIYLVSADPLASERERIVEAAGIAAALRELGASAAFASEDLQRILQDLVHRRTIRPARAREAEMSATVLDSGDQGHRAAFRDRSREGARQRSAFHLG